MDWIFRFSIALTLQTSLTTVRNPLTEPSATSRSRLESSPSAAKSSPLNFAARKDRLPSEFLMSLLSKAGDEFDQACWVRKKGVRGCHDESLCNDRHSQRVAEKLVRGSQPVLLCPDVAFALPELPPVNLELDGVKQPYADFHAEVGGKGRAPLRIGINVNGSPGREPRGSMAGSSHVRSGGKRGK